MVPAVHIHSSGSCRWHTPSSQEHCSSQKCQADYWKSHKSECNDFQQSSKAKSVNIPLIIENGTSKPLKQIKGVLFPYDEFVNLYNWERPGYPPCGLKTVEIGRRNDWCFLCELQTHLERASNDFNPFSPVNVLSRLPHIGGNLGYGSQEDAREFMRFAIDTMQSACLYEFGGKKAVHPSSQETTLVQHIFGGQLQSQVMCEKCNKISNQYENMMDLTVEIHGDAASLEECLMQFTAKEWLHGDNMYKCDACFCRCNDYVKAWKRLTVRHAPNILTVALKRFQKRRHRKEVPKWVNQKHSLRPHFIKEAKYVLEFSMKEACEKNREGAIIPYNIISLLLEGLSLGE
ncbi:hypothetical protein SAY86_010087 [Trapa natans]|uniref:USP domain-containing protein n=1 Tax=Trapa natans TaxID=22666 RepID=A0AAN7KX57_TRANT|nr:hypothetical protein SAY86_010087 [Trapa natans]